MKILSVDSSSSAASVAVLEDDNLLGEINFNYKKQHSVLLMDMIDSVLKTSDVSIEAIDGFVISKGPGSFTGLRIGMATIKAMAFARKKPLVSISSLDGLANTLFGVNGTICPIMDALRGNVYTAIYKFENNELKSLHKHTVASIEDLKELLSMYEGPYYFIGDGTEKHKDKILNILPNSIFAPGHINLTKASALGDLGIKLLKQGINDDLNTSAPIYLRKSQAEREYEERMGFSIDE